MSSDRLYNYLATTQRHNEAGWSLLEAAAQAHESDRNRQMNGVVRLADRLPAEQLQTAFDQLHGYEHSFSDAQGELEAPINSLAADLLSPPQHDTRGRTIAGSQGLGPHRLDRLLYDLATKLRHADAAQGDQIHWVADALTSAPHGTAASQRLLDLANRQEHHGLPTRYQVLKSGESLEKVMLTAVGNDKTLVDRKLRAEILWWNPQIAARDPITVHGHEIKNWLLYKETLILPPTHRTQWATARKEFSYLRHTAPAAAPAALQAPVERREAPPSPRSTVHHHTDASSTPHCNAASTDMACDSPSTPPSEPNCTLDSTDMRCDAEPTAQLNIDDDAPSTPRSR